MIKTPQGKRYFLRVLSIASAFDLFQQGYKMSVLSQNDITGKETFSPVRQIFKSGIKDIYKMRTRRGLFIECSKEHLFFVNGGYAPLEDMKAGDSITSYVDNKIVGDKVVSIEFIGRKEEMFDMDVPSVRNLFANGIKCHNSRWFRYLFGSGAG